MQACYKNVAFNVSELVVFYVGWERTGTLLVSNQDSALYNSAGPVHASSRRFRQLKISVTVPLVPLYVNPFSVGTLPRVQVSLRGDGLGLVN